MTQRKLCLILGDQLSLDIASLKALDKNKDIILMCEVWNEATYVKHHKKKIAFIFSAMRHFAKLLKAEGWKVEYIVLDEDRDSSFSTAVYEALNRYSITQLVVTEPGEYRVLQEIQSWESKWGIQVDILEDTRFICSIKEFGAWAAGRKQLRMEYFYRTMRKRLDVLMEDGKPTGGKWNYDASNRKPPDKHLIPPQPLRFSPDRITAEVLQLVKEKFSGHFGELDLFEFAVTREQALLTLKHFVNTRLEFFGDYQDAMIQGQPWMYHSLISMYLNVGLLNPKEVIHEVLIAYDQKEAPLNAVEGFIRQVIGWREFIRGIYWLYMPEYKSMNVLKATRELPGFYWSGETRMNCLRQCISETKRNAYAHHIQRLMVLGNFALLAGFHPDEVNEWYLIVYADAYEWVELPNVSGMTLFADGGIVGSKPYACSGSFINRMSDYCKKCSYNVSKKLGPDACPFNYLYWDFLLRNTTNLSDNPRLSMPYRTLARMTEENKTGIRANASAFLENLD